MTNKNNNSDTNVIAGGFVCQGDVAFQEWHELPEGFKEVTGEEALIVAHSETGHHHVVSGGNVKRYSKPGDVLVSFMVADAPIALKHLRSTDTHAPMLFKGTKNGGKQIWKITRQKESTPLGWRMAVD